MIGFNRGPHRITTKGFAFPPVLHFLAFWLAAAAVNEAPRPEVEHRLPAVASVFPQGSQPGERVRVEILGQFLDRATAIAFLDPAVTARLLEVESTRIVAEFVSPAEGAIGPHYFRVLSPRGASNAGLFRLGSQPHRTETEPNSDMGHAEAMPVPVTINARLDRDDDFDFFRFHAGAGETLIFDLRAARNGSSLDAALILLDAHGRKLEHDEDTFIWDPFFVHRFAQAGDYFVVVQPTHTRNDPGFAYQLDIRRDAHLETVSPLAIEPGVETEVTIHGQGLVDRAARIEFEEPGFAGELLAVNGASASARVKAPAGTRSGPHRFSLRSRYGLSNPVTVLVDSTPMHRGAGPVTAFPAAIAGTARYRQAERHAFEVQAGQTLVFEVRAQRFGSPVDSVIRILDAKGKALANNDDGNFPGAVFNKDSRLQHRFEAAGQYTIEMRNLWATTGENFPYELSIRPLEPKAELMLASDNPYVFAGEKGTIKISAARVDGLEGAIPLEVAGLPEGVTAKPASIAAGGNEVEIEVDATQAKAGAVGLLEVRSPVASRPAWRAVQVSSGGGEGRHYGEVDRATLAVVERPLFSLECASTALNLVRGGTVVLKVSIARREGFDNGLSFAALNLPSGVTMEVVETGGAEAALRFRASADAPAGRAARVSVSATGGGQTQAAPKISLLVD